MGYGVRHASFQDRCACQLGISDLVYETPELVVKDRRTEGTVNKFKPERERRSWKGNLLIRPESGVRSKIYELAQ